MPQAFSTEPSLSPIERPLCTKCQSRMLLARIESGPARSDLRTFECLKCQHVHKTRVEDPMKSTKVRWLNSGLKAPE